MGDYINFFTGVLADGFRVAFCKSGRPQINRGEAAAPKNLAPKKDWKRQP